MKKLRGFSLAELMIGIVVFSILVALAAPSFSTWIINAKIRTTAESIQAGLQLARAEAVRRNSAVLFQLINSTDDTCDLSANGPHWVVSLDNARKKCGTDPGIIQLRSGAEGSDSRTAVLADLSSFVFNGIGRLSQNAAPVAINISNSTAGLNCLKNSGTVRCLRVVVTSGGQIRMCDPALGDSDTQSCR